MMVWAVAPASEPAMKRSWTLREPPSLLPLISRLIYTRHIKLFTNIRKYATKNRVAVTFKCLATIFWFVYLLISHEFDSWLWGNFKHVDAVASPKRPQSSLLHHSTQATQQTHTTGAVDLLKTHSVHTLFHYEYCTFHNRTANVGFISDEFLWYNNNSQRQ